MKSPRASHLLVLIWLPALLLAVIAAEPSDGCQPAGDDDDTDNPAKICAGLEPLADGVCEVVPGGTARLYIGNVLTPDQMLTGGEVLVQSDGTISCVGCDCAAQAGNATRITCPQGVISPGLINTHDHLTYTQNDPYNDTGERYEQRHDWRKGLNGHTKITASGGATTEQRMWGELRFLMSGATSLAAAGNFDGLLRNLDATCQEGLAQEPVELDTFPLGDSSGTQLTEGCSYPDIQSASSITAMDAYIPHVAEGIDAAAHNEFNCTSSYVEGGQDLVQDNSTFIHAVALTAPDYAQMAHDGTGLSWSPRSNVTLYGDTAAVTEAATLGVQIALGTDWMPTGSMNMLRELRCAEELNRIYYDGFFTDLELWKMVTKTAAQLTATDDAIGSLETGLAADIAIFDGSQHPGYSAVIQADAPDVALVVLGGRALYGDAKVMAALPEGVNCDTIDVCGRSKLLCARDDLGRTYAELQAQLGDIYPAFFCSTPENEPSCTPYRPESVDGSTVYDGSITSADQDGDGIDDPMDNCPTIFNPVRPVDNGVQADYDGDGVGDVCDVCPLDPDTIVCSEYDPGNTNAEGLVINEVDYDQVDTDTAEFVELYNSGTKSIALAGLSLVFVNGADSTEYLRISLGAGGSLPSGAYLVAATTTVNVASGATRIDLPYGSNNIQNGAPDGIAIVHDASGQIVDAISYEGSITAAIISGVPGTVSLVEGSATGATDTNADATRSIIRYPNGTDTNNAATDWTDTMNSTPGAANVQVRP